MPPAELVPSGPAAESELGAAAAGALALEAVAVVELTATAAVASALEAVAAVKPATTIVDVVSTLEA